MSAGGGSAFGAIVRNELRLVRRTPIVVVMLLLMPLVVTSILKSTMEASLRAGGATGVNGSEQVVPGQALLFGFFLCAFIGLTFMREHGWETWVRLRASRASHGAVIVGKCLPWTVVGLFQMVFLFGFGALVFGLDLPGGSGLLGMAAIIVCWVSFVTAFSVAMVALLPSIQLINSVANLGALLFASLGGALVPSDRLPAWAAAIGKVTPTYWAMDGLQAILVDGEGVGAVVVPCLVLLGFCLLFGVIAARRFDFDTRKTFWA